MIDLKEIRIIDKDERDLQKDLELCNKATEGPWIVHPGKIVFPGKSSMYQSLIIAEFDLGPVASVGVRGKENKENEEFIAQAREGWPEAIQRAIEAESKLTKIQHILKEPVPFGCSDEMLDQIREIVE